MSNDLWRWADPEGQQRTVRFDELRASLAGGLMAPNTPVWRPGWAGWQPAQDVPELTSASHGGANGVVLNIPPPPLAMLAVQHEYEASSSIAPAAPPPNGGAEPPPPPRYVPLPVKAPSMAPPGPSSSQQIKTQLGGSAHIPASTPSFAGAAQSSPGSTPRLGPSLPTTIGLAAPPLSSMGLGPTGTIGLSNQNQPSKPPPPPNRSAPPPPTSSNQMIEELSGSMLLDGGGGNVGVGPANGGAGFPPPTDPIVHDDSSPLTGEHDIAGLPKKRFDINLLLDDIKALTSGKPPKHKGLLAIAGVVTLAFVVLLIAGIVSVASGPSSSSKTAKEDKDKDSKDKDKLTATATGSAAATTGSTTSAIIPSPNASIPPPPPLDEIKPAGPMLGDCATTGEAKTIAPRAVIQSGIEAHALNNNLGLGFAPSARDAFATSLDSTSLAPMSSVRTKPIGGDARRVTPMLVGGKLVALADVDKKGDRLTGRRVVSGNTLVDVGFADGGIVWAPHGKDSFAKLFSLEGGDTAIEALRAVALPDKKGVALTFRRGNAIHVGTAKGDGGVLEADGELSKIAGLGQVGSPSIAVSGDKVIVAWADRTGASDEWKVRWAKLKVGASTDEATPFAVPEGGLGGQAMSPSVAGLGGGKFLLAWTEGPVSNHQIRAITIGPDGSPSGSALSISGSGVNAGQPAAAVTSDGRGAVAFLTAKGKAYEVHATPISCAASK